MRAWFTDTATKSKPVKAAAALSSPTKKLPQSFSMLAPSRRSRQLQDLQYSNAVGCYQIGDTFHGFLYNGSSFTAIDDPSAGNGIFQGTEVFGISDNLIVGVYVTS